MNKQILSTVASTVILGSMSFANALPASCTALSDGGSTAANALSSGCSEIGSGEVHTITGSSVTFYGDVLGAADDVGQIIIDGDVSTGYENLGSSSKSLNNLTINSGKTLTLNGTGGIDASSITLGGTIDVYYGGTAIIGAIDGSSEGTGVLDINSYFNTGGVIGGTNKISSINIGSGTPFNILHDVSATQISLSSGSTVYFYGDGITIESDIVNTSTNDNSVNVGANTTFKGKIGTSSNRVGSVNIQSGKTLTLGGDVFENPLFVDNFNFYGGTLEIDPSESAISDGASVTIVDATNNIYYGGAVSITDTDMIDYTATTNDNTVVVSAAYKSSYTTGLSGESANIFNNIGSSVGQNNPLFFALNNATTTQEKEDILKSVKPDGSFSSTVGGINLSNSTGGTISDHLALLRTTGSDTGIATGDQMDGLNIWAQVFGNDIDQDNRGGYTGYDANSYGLVIGADKEVENDITVGLAFTFANSDVDSKATFDTSTDIKSYQLSAYLSKQLKENYFFESIFSYARNNNESTRNIAGGSTAYADFDSDIVQAQFSVGKSMNMGEYTIIPKAKLSYIHVNTDKYTETGAGALNLTVDTDNLDKFEAYAGTTITRSSQLDSGALFTPEFRIGLTHGFGDETVDISSSLQGGGNFNTTGLKPASTSLDTGFGLGYTSADKMTEVRFDYDLTTKSDYLKHAGMLTYKIKF